MSVVLWEILYIACHSNGKMASHKQVIIGSKEVLNTINGTSLRKHCPLKPARARFTPSEAQCSSPAFERLTLDKFLDQLLCHGHPAFACALLVCELVDVLEFHGSNGPSKTKLKKQVLSRQGSARHGAQTRRLPFSSLVHRTLAAKTR